MLIEETVTYLEMTAAEQLRPGRLPPAPVELVELGPDQAAASVLRRTCARIAAALNWQSRRTWSDVQWEQHLARQQVHAWVARVGDEIAGMVELEARPGGDVEIVVFGLVPEFVGRGFGAHPLTVGSVHFAPSDGSVTSRRKTTKPPWPPRRTSQPSLREVTCSTSGRRLR